MLRSLSSRLVPSSARLTQCLGLALERNALQAALIDQGDDKPRVVNQWQATLPHAIDDADTADVQTALVETIAPILGQIEQPYFAMQLALPDPLMQVKVFDLESVPASERARQEFARWRLSKDFHRDVDQLAIRTQTIVRNDAPPRLLVEAISQPVLDSVLLGARRAGAVLTTVDMAARFRQGQLNKMLASNEPAALFALERTYWSLLVWDERGTYRQLRARWRDAETALPGQELIKIFRQADQQLRLFNNEQDHPEISRLWVQDNNEITESLMTTLSLQTELNCFRISPGNAGVRAGTAAGIKSMTAVAAGRWS